MTESKQGIDVHFLRLVTSLQMAALQNMGRMASPVTNKVSRDFDQAQNSIDMLAMLAEKTDGNLTEEEKDLIDRILFELRMLFVEESKKSGDAEESGGEGL
jgi:hypothetical protein